MPLRGWPCAGEAGDGRKDWTGVVMGAAAGLLFAPGCGRPTGVSPGRLPRSKGEGDRPRAGRPGVGLAPGGVGLVPGGVCCPDWPSARGDAAAFPPGGTDSAGPVAGGGLPAPRRAPAVEGGTFFGFSVLIFCFNCASLGTPAHPRLSFGCVTLVFTAGGFAAGGAFASLGGAATISLFPCTFVSVPDLAATERLVADCRSMLSRWMGRAEAALSTS